MIRATAVRASGSWSEPDATPADSVVLDFDERHRRRIAMVGVRGLDFLLDLPEAVALRGGDALVLDDGRLVEVVAGPEPLVEVRGGTPADLVRLAWHIGNRHLPAQLRPTAIRIRRDHVIEDMLRGLGATLRPIEAPFDPEGGAYAIAAGNHAEGHGHKHDHGKGGKHDHGGHKHDHHDHGKHAHGDHGGGKHQHKHD